MALVIEAVGLRKTYAAGRWHRVAGLDGLDLRVEAGTVHGLLGPDGAGKTTTLKLLLGLARPSAGEVRLLGRPVPGELPGVMTRVGALVQGPRFSRSLSVRRNLDLLARASGVPAGRVDATLEQVGLAAERRTPVRRCSSASRQRLALAAALLREPDLLLLDEPTRGLDPAGAREVRTLIGDLAGQGVSVLYASRDLEEVRSTCTTLTVLDRGRTVAAGTTADLLGETRTRTRVGTDDPDAALALLREHGFSVERDGPDLLVQGHDRPEEVSRVLAEGRIYVRELSAVRPDLESLFAQLAPAAEREAS